MSKTLIPTLLTSGNTFLGFLSIYFSFSHEWGVAGLLIFYATVLDLFDGRMARVLNASNNFGRDMDSFADFLSFGVAPAFMLTTLNADFFSNHHFSTFLLYIIGFFYVFCAAARLSIFNNPNGTYVMRVKKNDPTDFVGMPSTFMGGILGFLMGFEGFSNGFLGHYIPMTSPPAWIFIPLVILGGVCLLIPVPFPKIGRKFFDFRNHPLMNYSIILFLILVCRWALLVMSLMYILLPLLFFLVQRQKKSKISS